MVDSSSKEFDRLLKLTQLVVHKPQEISHLLYRWGLNFEGLTEYLKPSSNKNVIDV